MRLYSSYSVVALLFTTEHDEQERTNLNKKWVTASFCALREFRGSLLRPNHRGHRKHRAKPLGPEICLQ